MNGITLPMGIINQYSAGNFTRGGEDYYSPKVLSITKPMMDSSESMNPNSPFKRNPRALQYLNNPKNSNSPSSIQPVAFYGNLQGSSPSQMTFNQMTTSKPSGFSPQGKQNAGYTNGSFAQAYGTISRNEEEIENRYSGQLERLEKKQDAVLRRIVYKRNGSMDLQQSKKPVEIYNTESYNQPDPYFYGYHQMNRQSNYEDITRETGNPYPINYQQEANFNYQQAAYANYQEDLYQAKGLSVDQRGVKDNNPNHRRSGSLSSAGLSIPTTINNNTGPIPSSNFKRNSMNRHIERDDSKKKLFFIIKRKTREQIISKMRVWIFTIFFPVLLMNEVRKRTLKIKKEAGLKFIRVVEDAELEVLKYIKDILREDIINALKKSKSMNLVFKNGNVGRKISEETACARLQNIVKPLVKSLLMKLVVGFDLLKCMTFFNQILSLLVGKKSYLPDYYLFECELNRLEINSFGSLRNVNKNQQIMIIGHFFIVRLLIINLLWEYDKNFPVKRSEKTTRIKKMIKPRDTLIILPECRTLLEKNPDKYGDESILGLLNKEQLSPVMETEKQWVEETEGSLLYWLENVLNLVLKSTANENKLLMKRKSL